MTTVALIEDDEAYREGIARLLTGSGRFEVTYSVGSSEDAARILPRQPPQLALVDVQLPGDPGPKAVLRLRARCPALRCVMLTSFADADMLFASLEAGAVGYLLKQSSPEEILAGLDEVLAGGAPMSRQIARRVVAAFERKPPAGLPEELTRRERDIMDSLSRGLTYKEIGTELGISAVTVKNHLYRTYGKLAVRSRTEAVIKWLGAKSAPAPLLPPR